MRFVILLLALVACDKGGDKPAAGAAPSVIGSAARNDVVAGWQKAGLTVSAMTADKSGAVGGDCVTGTVSGVDVVVCAFATPDEAKAAEAKGFAWVGETTGTSLAQGAVLVAVADRRSADPSGRTINTIATTFRGK